MLENLLQNKRTFDPAVLNVANCMEKINEVILALISKGEELVKNKSFDNTLAGSMHNTLDNSKNGLIIGENKVDDDLETDDDDDNSSQKISKKSKSIDEELDDLNNDLDIDDSSDVNDKNSKISSVNAGNPNINYSFHEEMFIMGQTYNAPPLDYENIWYGATSGSSLGQDQEYRAREVKSSGSTDMLSDTEAQDVFTNIQYASVLGTPYDVNSEQREKFNLWIKFNQHLFSAFESLYAVTRDVNYQAS